jgi:DNA-binding NarL/FixJ family response regulator
LIISGADLETMGLLRSIVQSQPQIHLLGESHSLDAIKSLKPDVILVGGSNMEAIEFCQRVLLQSPKTKVVLLSEEGREHQVNQAIGAGVNGVVLMRNLTTDTVRAISAVSKGHCFLSPEIAGAAVAFYRDNPL